MLSPKIILLKLAPSLIVATAVLAGLLTGAKIISKSIAETSIDEYRLEEYMRQSKLVISDATREVTEAIASANRFQFATNPSCKKDSWHEGSQPSQYLFDSLTGGVYTNNYGYWYLGRDFKYRGMEKIKSSADWKSYVRGTAAIDGLDRLFNR